MAVRIEADAYAFPYEGGLTPETTALMVIDMQVDFCGEGGLATVAGMDLREMRAPIEPIARVLAAARRCSMTVIYTREGHRGNGADLTGVKRFRSRLGGAGVGDPSPIGRILIRGEPGHAIIPELAPQAQEPIVDKVGSGCFYGTEVEHLLRNRGIRNLIFVGVTTECCVHTSLREASDRGFDNLLLEDCTAGTTPQLKQAAIDIIRNPLTLFGTVGTSQALLQGLSGCDKQQRVHGNI
ncbi:MAG TPA: isochorismatase family cysteine hydrolase [Steroidobacteraceae bacterium]|nr:isochorismatase family cysteine hydrolase [Steroidobacteraceae bacterium]